MPVVPGHLSWIELTKETTWGGGPPTAWDDPTNPPPKTRIIGRGDDWFTYSYAPRRTQLVTNIGHGRPWRTVTGVRRLEARINTWATPSGAKELIDWATKLTNYDLDSYAARFRDGVRTVELAGLKPGALTLGATAENQPLELELQLIGKSLGTTTDWSEGAYTEEDPYLFLEGTYTIDLSANAKVRSFNLRVNNTLDEGFGVGADMQWLVWTARQVTCDLTIVFEDANLIGKFESGGLASLKLEFTRGANTLSLDLKARCDVQNFQVRRPLAGVLTADVTFLAQLDPDATGSDLVVT